METYIYKEKKKKIKNNGVCIIYIRCDYLFVVTK